MAASFVIDCDGHIETDLNDITFLRASSVNDALGICLTYWGGVSGSVLITEDDKFYVCDGIDPTTGAPFTEEVEAALRDTFDTYEIL